MDRIFNFSAGPATLPLPVLEQARAELLDWHGLGASVAEISHRSAPFIELAAQAEADLRSLLSVPNDYAVLDDHCGTEEYGVGTRKDDTALLAKLQQAMDAMKADGSAARISTEWFGKNIIK